MGCESPGEGSYVTTVHRAVPHVESRIQVDVRRQSGGWGDSSLYMVHSFIRRGSERGLEGEIAQVRISHPRVEYRA